MSRYRKIDTRIWNDERFSTFSVLEKLAWFGLLTHPVMTPMGAGIFPPQLLNALLDYDAQADICPVCYEASHQGPRERHKRSAEGILEGFQEASLILRDNHLVVVKNFLLYNRPDNPNQLSGWIEWCEELPRSNVFSELRDYLYEVLNGTPPWLFAGLLDPLAEQENRTLKSKYWDRIGEYVKRPQGRLQKGSKKGIKKGYRNVSTNQEQEQEQEQKKKPRKEKTKNGYTEEFEEFWSVFKELKRGEGKPLAFEHWNATIAGRDGPTGHPPVPAATLIKAARNYAAYCKENGIERRFIMQPASFVGPKKRGWEAYLEPVVTTAEDRHKKLVEWIGEDEGGVGNG